jgi:hypothetical protein
MAYLAWIASELSCETSFPEEVIIPQKPECEEGQECWRGYVDLPGRLPTRNKA